ncbi:hypothetical protein GCM10027345_00240 [Hymenobacter daeguensis]
MRAWYASMALNTRSVSGSPALRTVARNESNGKGRAPTGPDCAAAAPASRSRLNPSQQERKRNGIK